MGDDVALGRLRPGLPRQAALFGLTQLWRRLHPIGRLALVGIVVAALATTIFFAAAAGSRRAGLEAERLAIAMELAAVAAVLVDLGSRTSLDPEEQAAVDDLFARLLDNPTRTGATLWALDGTIIADTDASAGTRFAAAAPWISEAADVGFAVSDTDVDDPVVPAHAAHGDHIDLYVAVPHPDTGEALARVEVHESSPALASLDAESPEPWSMVGGALFILVMSVVALIASTARVLGSTLVAGRATAGAATGDVGPASGAALPAGVSLVASLAALPTSSVAPASAITAPTPVTRPDEEVVLADALADVPVLRLSRRQREVLEALCAGLAAKEIAAELGLAEGTVGVYTKELYRKLGVSSRAGAVALALRRGLVH